MKTRMLHKTCMIVLAMMLLLFMVGCTTNNPPAQQPTPTPEPSPAPVEPQPTTPEPAEPPKTNGADIKKLIPLKVGNIWQYEGEGNEYASYTQEVLFQKDNRFQLSTDTGGTVLANIFEVKEDRIDNIYQSGEEYDHKNLLDQKSNISITLIKAPIEKGSKWVSEENSYEIIDTEAKATVPFGTFEDCILVKLTFKDGSETYLHYKEGIGLLQAEFRSGDTKIFSRLKKFTTK